MESSQTISWADFERIVIRVGTVIEVRTFPEARKPAYKLTIDFGEQLGVLNSSAQITHLYEAAQLVGRQVVAVVNFPPKQIGPFLSQCLVLGAVQPDGSVVLLSPERTVPNGLRIL